MNGVKTLTKVILPVVFIAGLALSQGKADSKNLFMQFKDTKSLQMQQDSAKSDSVKTNADSLQQKGDSLLPVEKILATKNIPDEYGGGKMTLTTQKLKYTVNDSEGVSHTYSYSIEIFSKHGAPEEGATFGGIISYEGKYWQWIDSQNWGGKSFMIDVPGFSAFAWTDPGWIPK